MKRIALVLLLPTMPAIACSLTDSPLPAPTRAPPPVLGSPMLGLNPVSGAPGTIVNVGAAGFPVGSKVNLYLGPVNGANPNPVAQNLTIGTGGILSFALQLPANIKGHPLPGTIDLNFTISPTTHPPHATTQFL